MSRKQARRSAEQGSRRSWDATAEAGNWPRDGDWRALRPLRVARSEAPPSRPPRAAGMRPAANGFGRRQDDIVMGAAVVEAAP